MDLTGLTHSAFGDSPELADALLALVLAGIKTATCWRHTDGVKGSVVGSCWVALDGVGRPAALIESITLDAVRFDAVTADFAHAEGESDRSLVAWRADHAAFFARTGGFAPDMLLWCERFRLVAIL